MEVMQISIVYYNSCTHLTQPIQLDFLDLNNLLNNI